MHMRLGQTEVGSALVADIIHVAVKFLLLSWASSHTVAGNVLCVSTVSITLVTVLV